jgi:molybdopterin molybdotransferase
MLSVAEASERIREAVPRLPSEPVPVGQAAGRILAADVAAVRPLPSFDNSAMDGFAVRAAEASPGSAPLRIVGVVAAGDPPTATLPPGAALRIMTGAPLPAGADAVAIKEEAEERDGHVTFTASVEPGDNIRRLGEDVAPGDLVLRAGELLGAGEVGLLAALGWAVVPAARRPRVAIVSTGDELVDVTQEPAPGQIVSSNAHALAAQVREAGGEPVDMGIAPDDRARVAAIVRRALDADVVLTSGGVSAGDFDHVRDALADAGVALDFWKVAMKPGKPLTFGTADGRPVFGLPGNPVSSMVSFELFVRPALLAMQGARVVERPRVPVVLPSGYEKPAGRAHFLRAALRRDGATLIADASRKQGSHRLRSMIGVDALVEIDRDATSIAPGATVTAHLLRPI